MTHANPMRHRRGEPRTWRLYYDTRNSLHLRLRVKRPGDDSKLVEQHLLCAHEAGRATALDLVCTGFRPDQA